MIDEVKRRFVSTAILIDDAAKLAAKGDSLAKTIMGNWEYPVDIMFLTPDGQLVSKLNSFKDFTDVHPGVSMPRPKEIPVGSAKRSHVDVFLEHVSHHFGQPDPRQSGANPDYSLPRVNKPS